MHVFAITHGGRVSQHLHYLLFIIHRLFAVRTVEDVVPYTESNKTHLRRIAEPFFNRQTSNARPYISAEMGLLAKCFQRLPT